MKAKRSIALPPPVLAWLVEIAALEGMSVSALVTDILRKEMKKDRRNGK